MKSITYRARDNLQYIGWHMKFTMVSIVYKKYFGASRVNITFPNIATGKINLLLASLQIVSIHRKRILFS